jgi:hypothetical protein
MDHIKHLLWLIKQMIVLLFKGDLKGSIEAWYWFRFHFTYKSKKIEQEIK